MNIRAAMQTVGSAHFRLDIRWQKMCGAPDCGCIVNTENSDKLNGLGGLASKMRHSCHTHVLNLAHTDEDYLTSANTGAFKRHRFSDLWKLCHSVRQTRRHHVAARIVADCRRLREIKWLDRRPLRVCWKDYRQALQACFPRQHE